MKSFYFEANMFSYCPKCETGKLNAAGNCGNCGYSLRNKCSDCGHLNIPGARFCGGCGRGMTVVIRAQTFVNRQVSFIQRLKMRKFATGLAFGGLLSFFAFGSMGMQGSHENGRLLPSYFQAQQFSFHEDFAVRFEKDLQSLCRNRRQGEYANAADLHQVVDLLIRHLKPLAQKLNQGRFPADSSSDYTRALHNFSRGKEVTRGSSAMLLFHFLSDFLEFNYRDFPQESSYNDIPRFHFMCVPATALKSLGIDLAQSSEDFGMTEPIEIAQLCNAARTIVANAEIRAGQKKS